jgi:cellulose 1,4-beta-cellobiosidase
MSALWLAACASTPNSSTQPGANTGSSGTLAIGGLAGTTGNGPATSAAGSSGLPAPRAGTGAAAIGGTAGATAGAPAQSGAAGTTPTGAAGTTPAGAAGSGSLLAGGYATFGRFHGYGWTSAVGTGSTIKPADFSMATAGSSLCASGTVGAAADYSGVAMVGLNLNQAQGMSPPTASITPMGTGLIVSVSNPGSSALRVQIQGPNGGTDPMDRWCAPLTGTGGMIPWSSFNTACWDGSGVAYASQPIVAALIVVPGGSVDPVNFDFCLNSLAENGGAGAAAGGAAPAGSGGTGASGVGGAGRGAAGASGAAGKGSAGASGMFSSGNGSGNGVITDPTGSAMVMRDGHNYIIQNNVWGSGSSQNLSYDGTTFEITKQTGNNTSSGSGAGGPVSFPSTFIGSNFNRTTSGSGLPKQVSALSSVKTGWSNNAGSAVAGTYNAAYDVWFSTGAGGDANAPSGGYLMVWFHQPSGAQPIGSKLASDVAISGADGNWDVWLGANSGNNNRPCISYVRTQTINSMEFDLNAFIKDATNRPGAVDKSWYLSNVFAGFEIWAGGVGLKTTAFYAMVS